MARVNITMPDSFMAQLLAEADVRKTKVSTLVAECIKDHYSDPLKAEYEEQLKALRQKCDATQLELLHVKEQSAQRGPKKRTGSLRMDDKLAKEVDELVTAMVRDALKRHVAAHDKDKQRFQHALTALQEEIERVNERVTLLSDRFLEIFKASL